MGMEYTDVKDFIEDKGLHEYSHEIVLDQMRNASYVNPLMRGIRMMPMGDQVNRASHK